MKREFVHRDQKDYEKWKAANPLIPVNEQQHSYDTQQRLDSFVRAQYGTGEALNKYNRYRQEWFRRPKEFDAGDFPLAVGIELVSTCNLGCSMCYTITEEFQESVVGSQRVMPWNIVTAIVDECAELGVYSILFSWRGESTLYKSVWRGNKFRFPDVLAYARKKGILEVSCLTNGQLLDEKMAEEIVEADPNWINFSIDGLGETYNKIRTPPAKRGTDYDAFQVVTGNIRGLVAIRDARGKTRPQIRSNTVYPPISEDPGKYYETMKEIGVDWVTVNEILDFRGSGADGEELPEDAVLKNWGCQYPFQRLMISSNGTIVPCTGAHNEEDGLVLGRYKGSAPKSIRKPDGAEVEIRVPERTLKDAWTCDKLKKIREIHQTGTRSLIKGCRNCRHGAEKFGVQWVPTDWNMEKMEWRGRKFRNG
ncbi:MAG: radical SAM protein [bacterium]|nr:radical SAM protein [bacterium]